MSKALVIKGADFSVNRIDVIKEHYNPVGVVDLTKYSDTGYAIDSAQAFNPYSVISTGDAFESHLVPVVPGETYTIKACAGNGTLIAGSLTNETNELDIQSTVVVNISQIIGTTATNTTIDYQFSIPEGCSTIYVGGRTSSHSGFNPNYPLTLTRVS